MPQLSKLVLSVIAYATEEKPLVEDALRNTIPEKYRQVPITKQTLHSQFNDQLLYFSLELTKKSEIEQTINYIVSKLTQQDVEYLSNYLDRKLSLDDKTLFLRLNKFKLVDGNIEFVEGSDVIRLEIKYNAYTNEDNSYESVRKFFETMGLIES